MTVALRCVARCSCRAGAPWSRGSIGQLATKPCWQVRAGSGQSGDTFIWLITKALGAHADGQALAGYFVYGHARANGLGMQLLGGWMPWCRCWARLEAGRGGGLGLSHC